MFVLGIDPGLSRCGYGIVQQLTRPSRRQRAVTAGVLRTEPSEPVAQRLLQLRHDIRGLLIEHRPEVVAIERVLFQVNVRTAIPVAQAAGVAMVEAADFGCAVVEYSPNQVKQTVTGMGGADKQQVHQMVQTLLGITQPLKPVDAADALALALCHLAQSGFAARTAQAATNAETTGARNATAADTTTAGDSTAGGARR